MAIAVGTSGSIMAQSTALNFDGIDDQITTVEEFTITDNHPRTIEAWIKTSADGDQVIAQWGIDENGKKCVLRLDSCYLRYEAGDGFSIATQTILNDGEWHHVAAVLPEGGLRVSDVIMYVDGEVEPHPGHFRVIETQASPLMIGNSAINTDRFFNGSIDELRIWNVERSAEDIAFYMTHELCDETGLAARYTMDEGEPGGDNTDIVEIVDNISGNNGTLENFTKESQISNWVEGVEPQTIQGVDEQFICIGESMTWIDGQTYSESNTTATVLIEGGASNTCDSIALLNLSVIDIDPAVTVNDPTIIANMADVEYQWLDCNNGNSPIEGANSQIFTPEENGTYAVEVSSNGCADVSECVEVFTVGIENVLFAQTRVFPNPNQGVVNIELGELEQVDIRVFDLNGKMIYQKNDVKAATFQFDLDVPTGTYLMELTSEGVSQEYKLVKQK